MAAPLQCNSFIHSFIRNSIDYAINSSFRKVFDNKSQEVIDVCLGMFDCLSAQQVIAFPQKFFEKIQCNGQSIMLRNDNAVKEIASLSSVGS